MKSTSFCCEPPFSLDPMRISLIMCLIISNFPLQISFAHTEFRIFILNDQAHDVKFHSHTFDRIYPHYWILGRCVVL